MVLTGEVIRDELGWEKQGGKKQEIEIETQPMGTVIGGNKRGAERLRLEEAGTDYVEG